MDYYHLTNRRVHGHWNMGSSSVKLVIGRQSWNLGLALICNISSVQFISVAQLCLTLCNPMACSMPGFPVHHQLPELAQIHVHQVSDAIQPSHPSSLSSYLLSYPASGSLLMSQFFASRSQSIGVSASASVLPMNIQGWFPSVLTGLISLQFKGLKEFSPTPQFKSINSLAECCVVGA